MCLPECMLIFLADQKEDGLGVNTSLLRGMKFFLLAGASIHLQACVWYLIACYNMTIGEAAACASGSWANNQDFRFGVLSSISARLVRTFYFQSHASTYIYIHICISHDDHMMVV